MSGVVRLVKRAAGWEWEQAMMRAPTGIIGGGEEGKKKVNETIFV
jgi:hypothetical protein